MDEPAVVHSCWTLDRVAELAPLAELSDVVVEVAEHGLELEHAERPLLRLVARPLDD